MKNVLWLAVAGLLAMSAAQAQEPPGGDGVQARELIYCADLMSHEEREAYRASMRAARTPEEKAALRDAHRQKMQQRASQRGSEVQCEPLQLRERRGRGQ